MLGDFTDHNGDGEWTDAEDFVDTNGNGRYDLTLDSWWPPWAVYAPATLGTINALYEIRDEAYSVCFYYYSPDDMWTNTSWGKRTNIPSVPVYSRSDYNYTLSVPRSEMVRVRKTGFYWFEFCEDQIVKSSNKNEMVDYLAAMPLYVSLGEYPETYIDYDAFRYRYESIYKEVDVIGGPTHVVTNSEIEYPIGDYPGGSVMTMIGREKFWSGPPYPKIRLPESGYNYYDRRLQIVYTGVGTRCTVTFPGGLEFRGIPVSNVSLGNLGIFPVGTSYTYHIDPRDIDLPLPDWPEMDPSVRVFEREIRGWSNSPRIDTPCFAELSMPSASCTGVVVTPTETAIPLGGHCDLKAEAWYSVGGNATYDSGEEFNDANDNGQWDDAEIFTDQNGNGVYDLGEPFVDVGNGQWDEGETFHDVNENGVYDLGESFVDVGNGHWNDYEAFLDGDGIGSFKIPIAFASALDQDGNAGSPASCDGMFLGTKEGVWTVTTVAPPKVLEDISQPIERGQPGIATVYVVKLEITKCPTAWMPEGREYGTAAGDSGNSVDFTATIQPPSVWKKIKFKLEDVSSEPGVCINYGDESGEAKDLKFIKTSTVNTVFDTPSTDGQSITTASEINSVTVTVTCYDWGAWGNIKASIDLEGVEWWSENQSIPKDDFPYGGNHIADSFAPDYKNQTSTWDADFFPSNMARDGDGFTFYEEYRGAMNGTSLSYTKHERLDVEQKELFVYDPDDLCILSGFSSVSNIRAMYLADPALMNGAGLADENRRVNHKSEYGKLPGSVAQYALHVKDLGFPGSSPGRRGWGYMNSTTAWAEPSLRLTEYVVIDRGQIRFDMQWACRDQGGNPDPGGSEEAAINDLVSGMTKMITIHEMAHPLKVGHHDKEKGGRESPYLDEHSGNMMCFMRYNFDLVDYVDEGHPNMYGLRVEDLSPVQSEDDEFTDTDGDGKWDYGEPLLVDHNGNGEYDAAVFPERFRFSNYTDKDLSDVTPIGDYFCFEHDDCRSLIDVKDD